MMELQKTSPNSDWDEKSRLLGTGRTSKACQTRWLRHLCPHAPMRLAAEAKAAAVAAGGRGASAAVPASTALTEKGKGAAAGAAAQSRKRPRTSGPESSENKEARTTMSARKTDNTHLSADRTPVIAIDTRSSAQLLTLAGLMSVSDLYLSPSSPKSSAQPQQTPQPLLPKADALRRIQEAADAIFGPGGAPPQELVEKLKITGSQCKCLDMLEQRLVMEHGEPARPDSTEL